MRPCVWVLTSGLVSALLSVAQCNVAIAGEPAGPEAFDYFRNSWQVIGLKDYRDGTRITPDNELRLGQGAVVRISLGPKAAPLGRRTKTLLDGWLPVVQVQAEEAGVRYRVSFWAAPLPTVKDWKAAFDWPIQGENYLNWIRIVATNPGPTTALAQARCVLAGTNRSEHANWSVSLAPGQQATTAWRFAYWPVTNGTSFEAEDAGLWLERTVRYWRELLDQGAQIKVPCRKATEALRAAHVCQLIASDHGELHAGEGFYDEFYIRDGAYQLLELEEAGLAEPARRAVEVYLRYQRPDGRFESQKDQLDGNGQALWALWQYWKITGDRAWLARVYPSMRRAVAWLRQARRQAPAESPFAGLLPAAVADGEFLWDGKHHIVGYDFWNLRGLLCTVDAAQALGMSQEAEQMQQEAEAYRTAIDAAWRRTGLAHFPPSWEKAGTHWGNTETLWPTELFGRDDPRVIATIAEVRQRHGGGFVEGTIRWTGQPGAIHPYLSSYTSMATLLRGDHEQFAEDFYWYLLHSSASHAFAEGIYFKRRYAWGETIPHTLGAANLAFMLRHALVHDRGDELHLLLGAPDWWLGDGQEIRVENAPTHFGPLGLRMRGSRLGVQVELEPPKRQPPVRVVLHLPQSRPALSVPPGVVVAVRSNQTRRWDFATAVALYQSQSAQVAKPIPGLVRLPLPQPLALDRCRLLDLAPVANTDPFNAPFGVHRPGKYLFAGLPTGLQVVAGVPFRVLDPAQNNGRGLVVLQGAHASGQFPQQVEVAVGAEGKRLFFLGNVHGWLPDDEGAGPWGAVAEYVIEYADGQRQVVPLISQRTADDWASEPEASDVVAGLRGDPWHVNVLGVEVRPVRIERVIFRDLGSPAAPVLLAVTLEQ